MKRLISALCILPPLILLVRYGSAIHFLFFLMLVIGVALMEFYRMLAAKGFPSWEWLGVTCGLVLPLAFYLGGEVRHAAVASVIMLSLITGLFTRQELIISVQSAAFTLLGVFYIGWLLSYVILLRQLAEGPDYVFYIFAVVWLGDAAAWCVGSLAGRHKLAPTISPRKTVEGAIGGLVGSLCGAIVAGFWLLDHLTFAQGLGIGGMLAVLGQLGDLSESLFKRSAGVKDSGALIPGHGGILDKVDGILFGAPALYYYVLYIMGQRLSS
ncbi:MAG TPA: phosphatidate cytidylyltransferase [Candidatus Udaeobacter sp.]|nr:phosphatidate cytidylyltransferase [Candidatus Udaeobacter sp.]